MEKIFTVLPETHDSDDVRWQDNGEIKGFGYRPKGEENIGLMRYPQCGRENYAMSVSSSVCTWCNFDANK